jgi:hypothetical protein
LRAADRRRTDVAGRTLRQVRMNLLPSTITSFWYRRATAKKLARSLSLRKRGAAGHEV